MDRCEEVVHLLLTQSQIFGKAPQFDAMTNVVSQPEMVTMQGLQLTDESRLLHGPRRLLPHRPVDAPSLQPRDGAPRQRHVGLR